MKKYDVMAVGEINMDLVMSGLQSMPAEGREIIAEKFSLTLGSSTAICASWLSALGLKTGFAGKIGNDIFGDLSLNQLKKNGIDIINIIKDGTLQTGLTISLSKKNDRGLVTFLGAIEEFCVKDIDLSVIDNTRHVHVGSFFMQHKLRPGLPDFFKEARLKGVTTSLDAGWDDTGNWDYDLTETLKYTDIFFPNEIEALKITKQESIMKAVEILSKSAKQVVVKCSDKGALTKVKDKIIEIKSYKVTPVDTTGAGDSFNAGFIYGFLNGFDVEKCMSYGNACGAICVTRTGGTSSCANLKEVSDLLGT
jgi:sugar/nucleoside kinase (ribokinase family)